MCCVWSHRVGFIQQGSERQLSELSLWKHASDRTRVSSPLGKCHLLAYISCKNMRTVRTPSGHFMAFCEGLTISLFQPKCSTNYGTRGTKLGRTVKICEIRLITDEQIQQQCLKDSFHSRPVYCGLTLTFELNESKAEMQRRKRRVGWSAEHVMVIFCFRTTMKLSANCFTTHLFWFCSSLDCSVMSLVHSALGSFTHTRALSLTSISAVCVWPIGNSQPSENKFSSSPF